MRDPPDPRWRSSGYLRICTARVPIEWLGLTILVVVIGLFFLTSRKRSRRREEYTFRFVPDWVQTVVLLTLVGVGAAGNVAGLNGFRYSASGLSEHLTPLVIGFVLTPWLLNAFLLVYVFFQRDITHPLNPRRLTNGLLLVIAHRAHSFAAPRRTSSSMLRAGECLLPSSRPSIPFSQATSNAPIRTRAESNLMISTIGLIVLGLLGAGLAGFLGESIKRGQADSVVEDALDPELASVLANWAVGRMWPSSASVLIGMHDYGLATDWNVIPQNLLAPWQTLQFRINTLLPTGSAPVRPENGSIRRVNYLLMAAYPLNNREGSTPGLLAGFLYTFPFPLNFAVMFAYMVALRRFLDRFLDGTAAPLSLLGNIVIMPFLLPLFESPIDFILILDDVVFAVLLLFLIRNVFLQRSESVVATATAPAPALAVS